MRYLVLLILIVFFVYLLKDYINFILAIIIFSYFSEVFIDIFSKFKKNIQYKLEQKISTDSKIIVSFKNFVSKFLSLIKIDIVFIYLFYLGCLFFIVFVVVPPVFIDLKNIFSNLVIKLPDIVDNLKNYLINNQFINSFLIKLNINLMDLINKIDFNSVVKDYLNFIQKLISYILNFIASNLSVLFFILVPLFSIYFLSSKEDFKNWIFNNFYYINELKVLIDSYDRYQKLYLKAILVNIFSIVIISSVVFYFIFGFKGVSLGILYGIFSFIPLLGPFLGSFSAIILAFSKSFTLGVIVIILVFIIQQISDNLIMPKIIKDHLNLNPLITIFSILGFSTILGFWAVFIAPPLILTIKDLIEFISQNMKSNYENK